MLEKCRIKVNDLCCDAAAGRGRGECVYLNRFVSACLPALLKQQQQQQQQWVARETRTSILNRQTAACANMSNRISTEDRAGSNRRDNFLRHQNGPLRWSSKEKVFALLSLRRETNKRWLLAHQKPEQIWTIGFESSNFLRASTFPSFIGTEQRMP